MTLNRLDRPERISRYHEWLSAFVDSPLWHRPAWLDATAGENSWDVVLLTHSNEIVAALPYVRRQRRALGLLPYTTIGSPPLTQALGPWWPDADFVPLDERMRRITELFRQLPAADAYLQNWVPEMDTWLPLHWEGYAQNTRYSYRIPLSNSLDERMSELRSTVRNRIRKAEASGVIVSRATDTGALQRLRHLIESSFTRQGRRVPYKSDVINRISCIRGGGIVSRLYEARLKDQPVAMTLVVAAGGISFNLAPGINAIGRSTGAGQAVLWKALNDESEFGSAIFDFEGSMLEGVERHYRHFGGKPFSYHRVERIRRRDMRIAVALRRGFRS